MARFTCQRLTGNYDARCARVAKWRIRVRIANFEVFLFSCDECHTKAGDALGAWTPFK